MRLSSLSPCLAAAAVLVPMSPDAVHVVRAARADASTPSCTVPGDRAFPLATRIHGGPGSYEAGGDHGTWYIDLTNATNRTCAGVHPVVVLVDDARALKPSQPKLDFYDGTRPLPVHFESTDEQELVGVLDAVGFKGFTVAPGMTVTVKLRLSIASDTAPDQVTASAAVVQRRGDDGDWVGESNAYRFGIDEEPTPPPAGTQTPKATEQGTGQDMAQEAEQGTGQDTTQGTGQDTAQGTGQDTAQNTGQDAEQGTGQDAEATDEPWEADGTTTAPATTSPAEPPSTAPDASRPAAQETQGGTRDGTQEAQEDEGDGRSREAEEGEEDEGDGRSREAEEADGAGHRPALPELARTGSPRTRTLLGASAALLLMGGSAFLLARRRL